MKDSYIVRKYKEFINRGGHIPKMFNAYDCREIKDIAPTLTTCCGSATSTCGILILEEENK